MNEGIYASERSAQINRDRFDHYCVSNSRGRKRALPPFFVFIAYGSSRQPFPVQLARRSLTATKRPNVYPLNVRIIGKPSL